MTNPPEHSAEVKVVLANYDPTPPWELDDVCKEYIADGDETASQLYDKVNEAAEAYEKAVAEMRDYTRKKLALQNPPPTNPQA